MKRIFTRNHQQLRRQSHYALTNNNNQFHYYSTLFGKPTYDDKLNQHKSFSVIETPTSTEDETIIYDNTNRIVNLSVELLRKDRVHLIRNGPSEEFPEYNIVFSVQNNTDDTIETFSVKNLKGTTNRFLNEKNIVANGMYFPVYYDGNILSGTPIENAKMYRIYLDSPLNNSHLLQLLMVDDYRSDKYSAVIRISSKDTKDEQGYIPVAHLDTLKKSKQWCIIMDSVNYLHSIQTNNKFYVINMFCYHLGNPLLYGQLYSGRSMEPFANEEPYSSHDNSNTISDTIAIECPTCEFKFTNLEEASYPVQIRQDGFVWIQPDIDSKRTGRPSMSTQSASTIGAFIDLNNATIQPY
jgi:hypothetical protein